MYLSKRIYYMLDDGLNKDEILAELDMNNRALISYRNQAKDYGIEIPGFSI